MLLPSLPLTSISTTVAKAILFKFLFDCIAWRFYAYVTYEIRSEKKHCFSRHFKPSFIYSIPQISCYNKKRTKMKIFVYEDRVGGLVFPSSIKTPFTFRNSQISQLSNSLNFSKSSTSQRKYRIRNNRINKPCELMTIFCVAS